MPNEQNLKIHQSPSEARENGRKGGIASGETLREKASMRAAAEYLLSRNVPPGEMTAALEKMGLRKTDRTYVAAVVAGLIRKAIDGNPAAFGQLMKLMGEGVEKHEISSQNEGALPSLLENLREHRRREEEAGEEWQ